MKDKLVLFLMMAILIPLGTATQYAAAEEIHIQASFYPYYEFTRNVVGSVATVEQFLPLGVEAHDWEPSISRVLSLSETDMFVYNGLGLETYVDRLAESDDLSHIVFVKASEGLVLISIAGIDEEILEALEEYDNDHYTAEEAVEAIESILDAEEIQEILEAYGSGDLTTAEALSAILDVVGGHVEHGDHGHDEHMTVEETDDHGHDEHMTVEETDDHGHDEHMTVEETDDHGHDEHMTVEETDDHGHDEHMTVEETDDHGHDEHMTVEDIRGILAEIHDGDTSHEDGLESIRDLIASEEHDDHDEHGHDEHDHGAFDPHVWLDPVLAVQQVENIRDALMDLDPDNASTYKDNAATYISELEVLHNEFSTGLSNCQEDTMITFHGAFAYLVERYGFETVSLAGITGTEEISTADIINLVEYVQANDVKYLLGDDVLDTRALETIADETDAEVLTLSPTEGISPEDFEAGVTYLDKMRSNLDTLKIALICQ